MVEHTNGQHLSHESGNSLLKPVQILAFLALAVSALAYPLKLDADLMATLYDWTGRIPGGENLFKALLPYLQFGFSPLTLKESLTAWALLPLIALWMTWKILYPPQVRRRISPELLFLLLFFAWAMVSTRFAPQFGTDTIPTLTAFNLAIWFVFFLAMMDLPHSPVFSKVSAWWLVVLGSILMLVSTAAAVEELSQYLFRVMIRLDQFYKRNLYGGLIGHNTGVASICMGPFFFALGMFLHTRRWLARILLGLYILLSLYFFLVTQSRAVWLLFLLLTPPFLLGLRLVIGTPIRLRHLAVGGLMLGLFIGSQFVPARWNFLHIEDAPFVSRLQSLTPRVLLTETRLRIIAVTLPLIAEKPLLGHGLSSFVSVYPKAQADYFSKHPDSLLYPTFHLTDQAHNDYLQLLLETGFLGFGLAGLGAFFFFRKAFRHFRRLPSSREKLLRYCAFFALGEILLHAFIDFPFHIAPLATFFLFYCGMVYRDPQEQNSNAEKELAISQGVERPSSQMRLRPGKVLALVLIFAIWGVALLGVTFTVRRLKGDILLCRAMALANSMEKGMPAGYYVKPLTEIRALLRQSLRVEPLDYVAQLHRGIYGTILARIYTDEALAAKEQSNQKQFEMARSAALQTADDTLRQLYRAGQIPEPKDDTPPLDLTAAIGTRVNHSIFHHIAQTWRAMAELLPPVRKEYMRRAFEFYQLTARYSPTYSDAIIELIDFMGKEGFGSPQQRRFYLSLIARRDREAFLNTFMARVVALTDEERTRAAEVLLLDMRSAVEGLDDEYPEVYEAMVLLYQVMGNAPAHHAAVETLKRLYPNHPSLPQRLVEDLVLSGKFGEAEGVTGLLMQEGDYQRNLRLLLTRSELLAHLGKTAESERITRAAQELADSPSLFHATRGYVRQYLMNNPQGALLDYAAALVHRTAHLPTPAYLALIRDRIAHEDWKTARKYLELARNWNPGNGGLQRMESELRQGPAAAFLFP